jgi:hypothetical protein
LHTSRRGTKLEQAFGFETAAEVLGAGEEMGLHSDGKGALDVDQPVVDEQRLFRLEAEAVEGAVVEGGIGLQELLLARDDDVAEAAEEAILPRPEGPPEIGGEIGDSEKRNAALVEFLDYGVDAGNRLGDRVAEALAPGRDVMGVIGEFLAELGGGLGEGAAGIERIVPFPQADLVDEAQARLVLGQLPGEEAFGIPAVKDVADVEDDGGDARAQPWRALKRRLVLLIT